MPFSRNLVRHDHHIMDKDYSETIAEVYKDLHLETPMECTFQVTERCNLACTYCYQINKTPSVMSFDVARRGVDMMLTDKNYVKSTTRVAGIIDFIGGEPLLEIDLIQEIYEYFLKTAYQMNHPWMHRHRVSFCSNGVLYMEDKVQKFLKTYGQTISPSITIDGPELIHDTCRKFHNGAGSHSIVEKSIKYATEHHHLNGTKVTISPENLKYLGTIVKYLYEDLHLANIYANCTFEGPWDVDTARRLYFELKKLADYCYENDTYSKLSVSFFGENEFTAIDYSTNDKNWCGGNGAMLAIGPDGRCYPCIRYMPSSLGPDIPPLVIGNVYDGLLGKSCEKCLMKQMKAMTASSQSPQKCLECPVASGCAWCSGYNYQAFKALNKRSTNTCLTHMAAGLANVYYWNKFYEKHHVSCVYENYLPETDAVKIIGSEEYTALMDMIECQRHRIGDDINGV